MLAGGGHPALLCIGLSGLGVIQETFGPLAAGTVERVAAQRVHSKIRRTDDVYRYSEGTLAVIYDGKLSADRLRAVAERILAHITTPVRFGTSNVAEIEASVGISSPSMASVSGPDLVREALKALEQAWRQGPNKISITVPSTTAR
jgi:diguanylate cyclase (GGDEF)-like protein